MMQRECRFIVAFVVFCLGSGAVIAAELAETDAAKGVVKLPENIRIELISPEHGTLMLSEEEGQVQLPYGHYRLMRWTLKKKDINGHTWELTGDVPTPRMIEVGPEPTTLDIKSEPIVLHLDIDPREKTMNFILALNSPSGEPLRVSGKAPGIEGDQLPLPTLVFYNQDKSYKKSYDFRSQGYGNYLFNWTPPSGTEGPFYVDVKVAGPFKTEFEPKNLTEVYPEAIAKQQALHRKRVQQACIIGLCYWVALGGIVGVLLKFRWPIAAAAQKCRSKIGMKRLLFLLGVFVLLLLLMLDPLIFLVNGESDLDEVIFQFGSVAAMLLVGTAIVLGVRKVRTKWPFVTILLYSVFFVLLLMPIVFMIFAGFGRPDTSLNDVRPKDWADFYIWLFSLSKLPDTSIFTSGPTAWRGFIADFFTAPEAGVRIAWILIWALLAAQASLLIVPIRIKHQRPKQRRGIWWTAIVAALLYTVLLFVAGLSVMSAVSGDAISEPVFWILVGALPLNWIGWSIVFYLFSRSMDPESYIRRLMGWLIGGSILELLIAVPSHIIVRHRNVCCAHGLTAAGLTTGLAVIFFAFGPGLYFLYADRIRNKKHKSQ